MTSPVHGGQPDFVVSPNLYTPSDLEPLLSTPDLAIETAIEFHVPDMMRAMAALGRVALEREDTATYEAWSDRATALVDSLQLRATTFEPTQFYNEVMRMRFFGAMHGNVQAAEQLHESLTGPNGQRTLDSLMHLCADQGVNPAAWIEHHASSPDDQANAWGAFMSSKRMHLQNKGLQGTAEELYEPGVERFMQIATSGELSARTTVAWGATAYRLAKDSFEKRQIISGYGLAISEIASSEEDMDVWADAVMAFATEVNVDLMVPQEVKRDFSQQVAHEIIAFPDTGSVESRRAFDLSIAIENGVDIADLLPRIEEAALGIDHPYRRNQMRDALLRRASEFYASSGQHERAADMMARITSTLDWTYAVKHYARTGGDLRIAQQADVMRQIFDDVPISDPSSYPSAQWEARRQITTFLTHMSPDNPDFAEARTTIMDMAKAMGERQKGALTISSFESYVERLLSADPASAAIGPDVVRHLSSAHANMLGIYELFAARGETELTQAGWAEVQRLGSFSAAAYLSNYARMALAATGVSR